MPRTLICKIQPQSVSRFVNTVQKGQDRLTIRARTGGDNQIVSSTTLFNELCRQHPDLLRVLMQPFYSKRHNVDLGNARPWCRQPIFSFFQGHFAAYLRVLIDRAYDMPEVPDMSAEQQEAPRCLEQCANDPALHVTIREVDNP